MLNNLKTSRNLASLVLALTFISAPSAAFAKERIISAGSAVTELIFALDAQESLVAVDVTSKMPQTENMPKIGYHRQLSPEGLLALKPTRIIGSDEMGPQSTLDLLAQSSINVNVVNTKPTIQGLLDRIDEIAKITNQTQKAASIKATVNQKVAKLNSNIPQDSKQKKVIYLLLHEGRAPYVAGKETTMDELIRLAGGINPASDSISSFKPVSMEAMLLMQPDVILVSNRSIKKLEGIDNIIKSIPTLSSTPAGQHKQVIGIKGSALVGGLGLATLDEAERLNTLLYQ
ncbi:hemin ABC transporter substrate-binding protein [Vibrionales bacterium C3R12]|uniref:heme/hemin ABC transporter substrate-binding protein n=1 Tax=Vibrio cortegadensis TaxID=1328770 RepID=UPI000DE87891|nr:ABC transporter substrate-binding protein [Vibrio cortegadensis]MDN3696928.1 ABC transporter substrate-binding protein [Vibrio cortegadensis]RBW66813.1 hemin ABC transporter substrate-binding protein [Vibrionales bacterium C3R12]